MRLLGHRDVLDRDFNRGFLVIAENACFCTHSIQTVDLRIVRVLHSLSDVISISLTFEDQYGFSTGVTNVVYLAIGIGYMVGLWSLSYFSNRTVMLLTKANNTVYEPEMRLNPIVYYACISPITFFWYA